MTKEVMSVENDITSLSQEILRAEESGNKTALESAIADGFTIIRGTGIKQNREDYLKAVPANAHRGRTAAAPDVRVYTDCASINCIVTTTQNPDGTLNQGRFWNTQLFIHDRGQWRCTLWQVTKIA